MYRRALDQEQLDECNTSRQLGTRRASGTTCCTHGLCLIGVDGSPRFNDGRNLSGGLAGNHRQSYPLLRHNQSSYLHRLIGGEAKRPSSVNHRVAALLASYFVCCLR